MTDFPSEAAIEDPTAVPLWMSITELAPVRLFREKTPQVEARQHDGSWLSAETISEWIRSLAPQTNVSILPPGTFNNDTENAYVAVEINNRLTYVASGDWIVYDYNKTFEFWKPRAFASKYEEVPARRSN